MMQEKEKTYITNKEPNKSRPESRMQIEHQFLTKRQVSNIYRGIDSNHKIATSKYK